MDEDRDMETQTFDDTQSDHILNVWTGTEANEDRSTEPFGDTIALESPSEETQLENIDNELLDIPDSVDGIVTQIVDDYEEVVLDSDDEGGHKTETACSKKLTSCELKRNAGGDVLDTPCVSSEDFVVGSVASSHKQCHAVYKRRRVFSVYPQTVQGAGLGRGSMSDHANSIGPSSIHSDACSQEKLDIKCDVLSSRKDSTLLTSEHETAKLRYNQCEEPGESSQDNALDFVDQYLSFNEVNLSEEVAQKKTSRQKSPPVSCAKGPQILARRAKLGTTYGMLGKFEWDANEIHDREGDLLKERKKSISYGEGPKTTSVTRRLGDRNLDVQSQMIPRNQSKENFQGEMIDADCINSSLIVLNSQEVGDALQASGMKFVKEMDDQLNAEASEQQLEACGPGRDVPDTFDVGLDTQMAAEAMEALFYAPPPNSNVHSSPQDQENMVEDSSKGSTGKCSFSKICSNAGVTARKLMPKNKPSKKLSGKLLCPFRKNKRSRKDLDSELPEANMVKRGKSLGENPVNSGNPSNAKKHSYRSSFTSIERRKEETVTERDNKKVDNKLVSSTSVESYSLGEGPLQGKRGMFSPLPNRNRSWLSVHPLEEFKDPTKSSEQRMGAVMEAGVLKKRRKNGQGNSAFQVLSIQGKRPNISLRTSEEAKDFKVSQPESHLKFTAWSYPRGKRTHRNVPCHSKGVSDICPPSALVKEEKGGEDSMDIHKKSQVNSETTCYSTESHKNLQRNSETSCFSFYVRRKRRSSACSHQLQRQNNARKNLENWIM